MADVSDKLIGFIPTVVALGVTKKTLDVFMPTKRTRRRKKRRK